MPKVDLVITDIDGTLVLPGKHNPTAAVRKAVADVHLAGITLAAATGRPYEMTSDLFLDVGLKDECVFDNGATIRNVQTGEIVWKNWLTVDRLRAIFPTMAPYSTMIDFFPVWREADPAELAVNDITESAPFAFGLVKHADVKHVVAALSALPNLNISLVQSFDSIELMGVQVTDKGSDKFHAVNKLREIVHSQKNQVLAIGDSSNDMPLFEAADIKVAMGNSVEELKARADFVVAPVEEDGFAEAMRKFVLN